MGIHQRLYGPGLLLQPLRPMISMASPFVDEVSLKRAEGKRVFLDREGPPPAGPQETKAKPSATGEGVDEYRNAVTSLHVRPQFAPRRFELGRLLSHQSGRRAARRDQTPHCSRCAARAIRRMSHRVPLSMVVHTRLAGHRPKFCQPNSIAIASRSQEQRKNSLQPKARPFDNRAR
jgi:hypothetical protein